MAYSKLHSSIVASSLWTQTDAVRILFITLLAMCDRDGVVYGSKSGISRMAMIDLDDEEHAWATLMSPDPDSSDKERAPENEGRRVERVSGGFRLLNFEYYRGLRNDDDRREQNRQAQARFKAKDKPQSAAVSQDNPPKADADGKSASCAGAEAEAEAVPPAGGVGVDGKKKDSLPTSPEAIAISGLFNRKLTTQWSKKERDAFRDGRMREVITLENLALIGRYYAVERAKGREGHHRRDVLTFLNNFDGELDRAQAALATANGSRVPNYETPMDRQLAEARARGDIK